MSQSILSVRIDEDVKQKFDLFCAEVGMNASVAINLFVRTVLRERRIPFEISKDSFKSQTTKNGPKDLVKTINQLENAKNKIEKIHSFLETDNLEI